MPGPLEPLLFDGERYHMDLEDLERKLPEAKKVWAFAQAVLDGRTNWTALMVGAGALAVILLFRGTKRVPGILIAVVGATVLVGALDLAPRANVSIRGALPQGLPTLRVPAISLHEIGALLPGALAIALVSFADMSVLSRICAPRR